MKHMKAVPQSKSKLAISAGLSALMVVSSLGVAPAMAFAGPSGRGVNQPKQQPTFEDIVKKVVSYDAAVLHPNAKQDELNKIYHLNPAKDTQLVTPDDVAKEKTAIDQTGQVNDNAKLADNLTDATAKRKQAQKDLHTKYVAQENAEKQLEEEKNSDPLADLAQDASQALKDKALASHQEAVKKAETAVENAEAEVAAATKALQQAQYAEITLKIASLKDELATKVPESKKLANYEKWLAGKLAESKKLEKIDLGDFAEQYLMIPREEMDQTETWEALIKKQEEVKKRIATLEGNIKRVKDNADFKTLTESIKDLESQFAYLQKQLAPKAQPSVLDVLRGLNADDVLNNAAKLHIASIDDLTKPTVDPAIELLAKKAESEGLSFAAKQIRKAKTVEGAKNLLKEAEKSAIETLAQKAEKEGFTFAAKQIRKAKTVEGARALLKAAEDSKPNTPAKPSVSDVLSGLSADDMINKVAGFKLDKDVVEAIKKDLASTYNHDNNTETPGSDQTPAPDNSGDASNDQKPEGKEEDKAQAEKTPKTGDFFAALLPMLGVALGGTSIAFGKRMRH